MDKRLRRKGSKVHSEAVEESKQDISKFSNNPQDNETTRKPRKNAHLETQGSDIKGVIIKESEDSK